MKIKADDDTADGEPPDQNAGDEILRGEARQRGVERQHHGAIEAVRSKQPQFGGLVGQPEQRLARVEEVARMRLEGQDPCRLAEAPGARDRRRDHGPVAAVDAIEIAHGEDGAAERAIGRCIAHDEEAFRRHRPAMVKKSCGARRCRRGRPKSSTVSG